MSASSPFTQRAQALIERARSTYGAEYEQVQDEALVLINERLDAEGHRGLVWGNMTYACERCGGRRVYEMEVGVEGPPAWREDLTYIASAFSAGLCDICGGTMTHVNFRGDVTYDYLRVPSVADVFRVPRGWPSYPTRGIYDDGTVIVDKANSAFLSLNLGATA